MTLASCYIPPTHMGWQGRVDLPDNVCFFQVIQILNLQSNLPTPKAPAFALLGFACDEGIKRNFGRIGAAEGPFVIRHILAKMPVARADLICYDAGDITCHDGNLAAAQTALAEAVALLLQHGITPIVMGGGHELAFGHYQGISKHTNKPLGIINFDAHFDMRPLTHADQGHSGTPFLQIAKAHEAEGAHMDYNCIGIQPASNMQPLFVTAKHYQVRYLLADDVYQDKTLCLSFIDRVLAAHALIYVSLCLDVFAAAYAPGVSAPQAAGLTPWQIIPLLRHLARSGKILSYDIAELSPKHDTDYRTARLAAHFIYEIIHNHIDTRNSSA